MATEAHYIYSVYRPEDREKLEEQTGQHSVDLDPWQTESSSFATRRRRRDPRFVPASASSVAVSDTLVSLTESPWQDTLGSWYRDVTARSTTASPSSSTPSSSNSNPTNTQPDDQTTQPRTPSSSRSRVEVRDRNNWFIHRVLREDPSTSRSASSTPPSLDDILARDPPSLLTEAPFKPPVFIALGPANKGYGLLSRSGWREGEGLGPAASTRMPPPSAPTPSLKRRKTDSVFVVKQEEREIRYDLEDDEVIERRMVDVVDLTLDSEDEEEEGDTEDEESIYPGSSLPPSSTPQPHTHPQTQTQTQTQCGSERMALLTPIATVLKNDRLGVGLKAKTEGPYKASRKRVTHGAAALAAHIKANEELRRKKKLVGRGSRGFARARKQEEASRRNLLAYMNG